MSRGAPAGETTDVFTREQRSAVMRRVKGKDTAPERLVRRLLTSMGVRYRLNRRDLPGSPDIAIGPRKLAIFVHGCFWHGHGCKRGARAPKQNAAYWSAKIGRNRSRDEDAQAKLTAMGWRTLILWECNLKDEAAVRERLGDAIHPPHRDGEVSPKATEGPYASTEAAAVT